MKRLQLNVLTRSRVDTDSLVLLDYQQLIRLFPDPVGPTEPLRPLRDRLQAPVGRAGLSEVHALASLLSIVSVVNVFVTCLRSVLGLFEANHLLFYAGLPA